MAFLVNDIFKRDIESCPERLKSFLIRDILSRPKVAETADAVVQNNATIENSNASLLIATSTTSLTADCLDQHQFHSVSLYVPSVAQRHHQPQLSVPAFQQPQTTFLLPTTNGNERSLYSFCRLLIIINNYFYINNLLICVVNVLHNTAL